MLWVCVYVWYIAYYVTLHYIMTENVENKSVLLNKDNMSVGFTWEVRRYAFENHLSYEGAIMRLAEIALKSVNGRVEK